MIWGKRLGGLGNQLFITMATYIHSLDMNTTYSISKETNEGMTVPTVRESYNSTMFAHCPKQNIISQTMFREPMFNYTALPRLSKLNLMGYYQSAKYFNHRRQQVVDFCFTYFDKIKEYVIPKKINTVSIHVRRTDYLHLSAHPVQTMNYYKKAIEYLNSKTDADLLYIIFSDDIKWCRQQPLFNQLPNVQFHSPIDILSPEENTMVDLYNMARCQHHIIANSSFSWWGAYLGDHPDKITIAPSLWFNGRPSSSWKDVYEYLSFKDGHTVLVEN
jgi:hypothetical protein